MSQVRAVLLVVVLVMAVVLPAQSQKGGRRPLAAADVDAITQLVMLEDTRQFDEAIADEAAEIGPSGGSASRGCRDGADRQPGGKGPARGGAQG